MKIVAVIVGPHDSIKGLLVAKAKADDGREGALLVKQKGENAVLMLHSSSPSTIGNETVIAWKGEAYAKGDAKPGAVITFDGVDALLKPSAPATDMSANEVIAKQQAQIAELAELVKLQANTIGKNATPVQKEPVQKAVQAAKGQTGEVQTGEVQKEALQTGQENDSSTKTGT